MQIPLRASGSSEIFPGTPRRPDETQSHYWPYGQRGKLLTEAVGKKGGRKKQETDRGGIFTTWTHTPHPQGESKLQSALQERRQRITDRRSPERWVGEKERRNRTKGKCECVFVDNWSTVNIVELCVCVSIQFLVLSLCDKLDIVQHYDHDDSVFLPNKSNSGLNGLLEMVI